MKEIGRRGFRFGRLQFEGEGGYQCTTCHCHSSFLSLALLHTTHFRSYILTILTSSTWFFSLWSGPKATKGTRFGKPPRFHNTSWIPATNERWNGWRAMVTSTVSSSCGCCVTALETMDVQWWFICASPSTLFGTVLLGSSPCVV